MVKTLKERRLLGLMVAVAALLFDLATKEMMLTEADRGKLPVQVTGFFDLVMSWNRGISFGMLNQHGDYMPWILTFVTLAITGGLIFWLWRAENTRMAVALGLIIGGALGNIADRLRFGAVRDFLSFHIGPYAWPAFNVADSTVFIGVVILVLDSIVSGHSKSS